MKPTTLATPCRNWQGARTPKGYGLRSKRGKLTYLHRQIVEMAGEDQTGTPWDPSLHVMHLCDNPPCYRFDHLRLCTRIENMQDAVTKRRIAHGERVTSSKLTEDQVREIRACAGMTQREIAAQFGVGVMTVNHILRRRTWGWLP